MLLTELTTIQRSDQKHVVLLTLSIYTSELNATNYHIKLRFCSLPLRLFRQPKCSFYTAFRDFSTGVSETLLRSVRLNYTVSRPSSKRSQKVSCRLLESGWLNKSESVSSLVRIAAAAAHVVSAVITCRSTYLLILYGTIVRHTRRVGSSCINFIINHSREKH